MTKENTFRKIPAHFFSNEAYLALPPHVRVTLDALLCRPAFNSALPGVIQASQAQIAANLGFSRRTVHAHLQAAEAAGLIRRSRTLIIFVPLFDDPKLWVTHSPKAVMALIYSLLKITHCALVAQIVQRVYAAIMNLKGQLKQWFSWAKCKLLAYFSHSTRRRKIYSGLIESECHLIVDALENPKSKALSGSWMQGELAGFEADMALAEREIKAERGRLTPQMQQSARQAQQRGGIWADSKAQAAIEQGLRMLGGFIPRFRTSV